MARKQWRCFFCDEVFTRSKDAAEHFGVFDACEADVPACKIAAHEGHLVTYIRKLESEVRRYQSDDSDIMRSIMTLEANHRTALIRAEEAGYGKGVRDTLNMPASERERLLECDCQNPRPVSGAAGVSEDCPIHGKILGPPIFTVT